MSGIDNPTGIISIGTSVVSGTPGSVLFVGAGSVLAQDNAKFFWDDTAFNLGLKAGSTLSFGGATSGTVTVGVQAVAGTWSMKLPINAGTNGFVLQTDGTGITSWVAQTGGGSVAIGGTVTGGTSPAILFINPNGILAQDPTNLGWDSTNKALLIESKNAIFVVPNALGDNWFEGGAGNFTLTGNRNFGTGRLSLAAVTTGIANTALGDSALAALTTGSNNTGIGSSALLNLLSGIENVAIGTQALQFLTTGLYCMALGFQAQASNIDGSYCVAMGPTALFSNLHGQESVGIGYASSQSATTARLSTAIGSHACPNIVDNELNVFVGAYCGFNINGNSQNNTWLGLYNGPSAAVNNTVLVSIGTTVVLDFNFIKSNVWSFENLATAIGLHVYNTLDSYTAPVNYERGLVDWTLTANIFRIATQAGGTGVLRLIAIDGFQKAGAPAAGDLPSGTWGLINDTTGGNTWLVYNNAGTIRKVQLI